MCVYVSESSVIECIQDCEYVKCVFTLLSASYAGTRGYGSRYYSYLVLRDNEIHVLLSRTAKRIHLKVIIPQECAAEECGANFYTVTPTYAPHLLFFLLVFIHRELKPT